MSTPSHHESSAHGNDGIQLKVKDCTYDEDTNPACLMLWLTLVSGVVSTHGEDVSGGAPLENFLDNHLDRRKGYVSTKPAFLEDPDLQLPENDSDAYVGSLGRSNET